MTQHDKLKALIDAAKKVCEVEPVVIGGDDVCPIPMQDSVALYDAIEALEAKQ